MVPDVFEIVDKGAHHVSQYGKAHGEGVKELVSAELSLIALQLWSRIIGTPRGGPLLVSPGFWRVTGQGDTLSAGHLR